MNDYVIARKYRVLSQIGSGSFGQVYKGISVRRGSPVAIKLDNQGSMLKHETTILKYLYDANCRQIPAVYWYGPVGDKMGLVMSYYDGSLTDYLQSKTLSVSKLNNIIVQYIHILESIHNLFVIHRDIKPQNCMIKRGELFLVDFGMAIFYIDDNRAHAVDAIDAETIIGSPKYISYYIHQGHSPSRRDDMISLGYMYLFLLHHELPWETVNADEEDDCQWSELYTQNKNNQERMHLKQWDTLSPICSRISPAFEAYMRVCYSLAYEEMPNYFSCAQFFYHT